MPPQLTAPETDVRAFLGSVSVRVYDDGNTIIARGESGARDLPVPGIEPRDAFGGFELWLDSWAPLRAVTTRTTSPLSTTPLASDDRRGPTMTLRLSNEPVEFSSSVATDRSGRAVHILAENGARVLGMTSSLDALDELLRGSTRASTREFERSELSAGGPVQTVWHAIGPTAIPTGDFFRWRGRLLATPGWDDRTTGSMPPRLTVVDGRANLLLQAPEDLAAALEGGVRSVTQNVISVPRSECSGPVSIRTTALWNGRRVEIARSYLVWRDRGLAVITGDGARPDSRSLRTPPLQFLPATGSRWTAAVAHDAAAYRAELDARLHDHGLSRREFRRLVSKPIHRLSADEMDTLIDIRDGLDPIRSGDVIQKVMPLKQSIDMLSDIANGDVGYYAKKGVPGFIAKFAHLTAISNHGTITPLRVFQKLGLGYNSTAFPAPSANPVHGVRMRTEIGFDGRGTPTSDVHDRMLPLRTIRGWMQDGTIDEHQWDAMSVPERRDRLEHLIDGVADTDLRTKLEASLERNSSRTFTSFDPFRGNGWAGHYEHYTPEVELRQNTPLTPGAELWRYNVDGTQEILAKWDGVRWHVI